MTNRITIGGLPGTGTSTLCRLLEAELGWPYVYAGQIFRDAAKARGMDLAEFGALCQEDPAVDQALDGKQATLLQDAPLILEGRLSGWLAHRDAVPALKVWVTCDEAERARRVAERDGGDAQAQMARNAEREASERDRYQRYYGVDLRDRSFYDMVLDSTQTAPQELADRVLSAVQSV